MDKNINVLKKMNFGWMKTVEDDFLTKNFEI